MKPAFLKNNKIISAMLITGQILFAQNLPGQDESSSAQAKINISFIDQDSVKQVKAVVTAADSTGKENPVADVEVVIYAIKSFGLLPLGDPQTTDENGETVTDFPIDLPGDSLGNIQIIAKVEDNDELGNLEDMKTVKWGIPVVADQSFYRRALWASGANAPLPLVFTVTSMVVGVWGVIIYIFMQLFKIRKS